MFNLFDFIRNTFINDQNQSSHQPTETTPLIESTWENSWGQSAPHQSINDWSDNINNNSNFSNFDSDS